MSFTNFTPCVLPSCSISTRHSDPFVSMHVRAKLFGAGAHRYSSQGRPHQVCGALSSQVCEPRNVHGVELVAGVDSLHSTLFCPIIPL